MPLKGELQLLEYPFALAMLTVDPEPCENWYPLLAAAYGSPPAAVAATMASLVALVRVARPKELVLLNLFGYGYY